ncbi:MAG: molybdopterin converting factor subunit 1 [Myxococcota bacterium]
MKVTVLYFAAARERANTSRESFELSGTPTVAKLLEEVRRRHPPLADVLKHLRVAVNQEFAALEAPLEEGAQVALIPPVAGGSGSFAVVDRPLALSEVVEAVGGTEQGGLVTFTGVVRDQTKGRAVKRLEYEAYVPMAEKKLSQIGAEAVARWPGTRLSIVHRVGTLLPGEAAVVIAASAPHRKEAFRACEYAIDRLKEDVPIWKKEHYADGEVWVGLGP